MPAAELKSWLQWHLPPTLRVLPHKQIKQLYLFLSPLHFTPMTLHLHLSSLSPVTPLRWQRAGCHLYANTWGGGGGVRGKKRKKCFPQWKNKHSLTILQVSLFAIWLGTAFRLRPAVSNQGLRADGNSEHTVVVDGKRERGWLCRDRPLSGEKNKNPHKCISSRRVGGERMLRVLFHSSFLNLVESITLITGLLWINRD